ncbi:hypothetical protein HmCmsJML299_01542 [Escherichia coli]|nr:hypothetical protein HmCmsJML045_02344 [Escherichia coli]GCW84234.1 hypothetical protein HmCmsJML089_00822 [Escherichia coli]GDB18875.1 hypothetical protein HmCmsJML187_04175 [Escherichia coli]GDD98702.1 hypothetical protein HmCmsJML299_01542 [Escherichia coli]GDE45600.1 hypothetical protein HmCmsJML273_02644 [Escherichia coli]
MMVKQLLLINTKALISKSMRLELNICMDIYTKTLAMLSIMAYWMRIL